MLYQNILRSLCVMFFVASSLTAQDSQPSDSDPLIDDTLPNQDSAAVLPPVEVRPPEEAATGEEPAQGQATFPPVTVTPEQAAGVGATQPSNLSLTYPSLSDQILGGIDGGTRGAPQSIFDSPRSVEIVTQQQLTEKSPIDMGQALEQTPGIMMQRTGRGQSSPFIRGLTGNQVLILIDGVRMTNATFRAGPNQYFNTIDPNMVDRVEVVRGPASVLYGGDAIGGVINVITKKSNITDYNWLTGTTVQRFSTADLGYSGRLNVEGSIGSAGIFAGGGYGNYNALDIGGTPDTPPGFDPGRQPATSWRYNSGDIKFNYALSNSDEVLIGWQHYEAEDVFRTDRFVQDRQTIFDPQQRELAYLRFQGINDLGPINSYQITGSFYRTNEVRRDERPIGTFDALREFTDDQTGVNAVFGTDLGVAGWLTYGVDWYHDEVDASIFNPDGDGDTAQFPNDAWYSRYGAFMQWHVPLTCRLRATSGLRYEHVTAGGTVTVDQARTVIDPEFQDWIAHGGLSYEVMPWFNLVGSISEGFRAPNLDDLAAINGNVFVGTQLPNPDLDPETSITYEVGAKIDAPRLRGQAIVWWTDLEDHILRAPPNDQLLLTRTNKDSFLQGVEFSAEYLLPHCWSVYGNFWYTFGRDNVDNVPLSRIPPAQGIVGLRRRWSRGKEWFDVYAWLVREQDRLSPRDLSDTRRIPAGGTPGYGTVNFRYGRMISQRQRLALNVGNLFDEQYRVHGSGSDGPGINTILSYELLR